MGYGRTFFFGLTSVGIHSIFFWSVNSVPEPQPKKKNSENFVAVTVREFPKIKQPEAVEEKVLEKEQPNPPLPQKSRPPRARPKPNQIPEPAKPKPQEVRAGIADSMALPGQASTSGLLAASGNSGEVAVDPRFANPSPLSGVASEITDPDSVPVSEVAADVPARCPPPPSLDLTDDAVNAGITTAEITVDVFISSNGKVRDVVLKKGTGYLIDKKVVEAASKLICEPARVAGKPVAVKNRRLSWKVIYE